MSFQGIGGSRPDGDQRERKFFNLLSSFWRKNINPYKGRSPVDQHKEELKETIRGLISNRQDTEVQAVLRESYHAIQDNQRPSMGVVITQIAQLVDLGCGNISPREAIIRMAGTRLDYQAAVEAYLDEPEDGNSPLLSSPCGSERDGDPDKVEGLEEEDRRVSDDTGEESESSQVVCTVVFWI